MNSWNIELNVASYSNCENWAAHDSLIALPLQAETWPEVLVSSLPEEKRNVLDLGFSSSESGSFRHITSGTIEDSASGQRVHLSLLFFDIKHEQLDFKSGFALGGEIAKRLSASGLRHASCVFPETLEIGANLERYCEAIVRGIEESTYSFNYYKSSHSCLSISCAFFVSEKLRDFVEAGLRAGRIISESIRIAKNLSNHPANVATPEYLANCCAEAASRYGFRCTVMGPSDIQRERMGGLLAVSKGSREEPRFVILDSEPLSDICDRPIVLIGKGVTFDSGGLSIKAAEHMEYMKFDMAGAAAVFGAFLAACRLTVKRRLIALLPFCENMPSGAAMRPGDIVQMRSGCFVEVVNTDFEGRLVLGDALDYAKTYDPDVVIDIATLTGAVVTALGFGHAGLFSPDDLLAAALDAAGSRVHDFVWRLPISDQHNAMLKSNVADTTNYAGQFGGASIGAAFLQRFAPPVRWAHLDIPGVAWLRGTAKGATGRPTALLIEYLRGL